MPGLREGLFFDDVMLLPRRSEVGAFDVSLESRLSTNVVLLSPFVTSARQPAADYRLNSTVARWWHRHHPAVRDCRGPGV